MSDNFYSVEYLPKGDGNNCWNQWALTPHKWSARLLAFELRLRLRKGWHVRTRVV